MALQTTRNVEKAFALYEKAYEMGCTDVYALAAYGVLLMRKRQPEKAVEVLKRGTKQPRIKPGAMGLSVPKPGTAYCSAATWTGPCGSTAESTSA